MEKSFGIYPAGESMVTVQKVMDCMQTIAPSAMSESWDNEGLLLGDPVQIVQGILVTIDITLAVAQEAVEHGCNMIVSHHPLFFRGTKSLSEDLPEGKLACFLVRNHIALYAAHTSLDIAPGGVNDALADTLGLTHIVGDGFFRVGAWHGSGKTLLAHVKKSLHAPYARLYGDPTKSIDLVATACGAGMEFATDALLAKAQVLITGDVRHHEALDCVSLGLVVIDAGHRATELVIVDRLRQGLQMAIYDVQCHIQVLPSKIDTLPVL